MKKDDWIFLGGLLAAYYFLFSLCLAHDFVQQREELLDKTRQVQELKQKIDELQKVQKSSVKLVSELASKSR